MRYEPEEQIRNYKCPECQHTFTNPAELKWFHFTDGHRRKQCIYREDCPFHPDEVLDFQRDIDELDWQT